MEKFEVTDFHRELAESVYPLRTAEELQKEFCEAYFKLEQARSAKKLAEYVFEDAQRVFRAVEAEVRKSVK